MLLMYVLTADDAIVFEYTDTPGFQDGHIGLLIHSKYVLAFLLLVCVQ